MSDIAVPATTPASPLERIAVAPDAHGSPGHDAPAARVQRREHAGVAAVTDGLLRAAYAQYLVDPDTHDVVVRIREAGSDRVLNELPSAEVQAISRRLREYRELLERRATLERAARS
ncbi:MAG: flagellar protein FlaG [Chloroflexota bacterium]|nr:flagellar protein FlaG [Chloroflexota bacterium]